MKKPTFRQFLNKFPEITLPITLTEESHLEFSRQNEPLAKEMIEEFIFSIEQSDFDEFTEFIPCVKIPDTHGFHAIVYWRAGLLDYEYTLATFTEKGQFVDKKFIAGNFDEYPIWIARYSTSDPTLTFGNSWIFWQYGNRGYVKGIEGYVDLNVFNGRLEDLEKMRLGQAAYLSGAF